MCVSAVDGNNHASTASIPAGITDTVGEMLIRHQLRWLGHLGRMGSERLSKQLLFGEFIKTRPQHGAKKRWMDCIAADLMFASITEWYETSQD